MARRCGPELTSPRTVWLLYSGVTDRAHGLISTARASARCALPAAMASIAGLHRHAAPTEKPASFNAKTHFRRCARGLSDALQRRAHRQGVHRRLADQPRYCAVRCATLVMGSDVGVKGARVLAQHGPRQRGARFDLSWSTAYDTHGRRASGPATSGSGPRSRLVSKQASISRCPGRVPLERASHRGQRAAHYGRGTTTAANLLD